MEIWTSSSSSMVHDIPLHQKNNGILSQVDKFRNVRALRWRERLKGLKHSCSLKWSEGRWTSRAARAQRGDAALIWVIPQRNEKSSLSAAAPLIQCRWGNWGRVHVWVARVDWAWFQVWGNERKIHSWDGFPLFAVGLSTDGPPCMKRNNQQSPWQFSQFCLFTGFQNQKMLLKPYTVYRKGSTCAVLLPAVYKPSLICTSYFCDKHLWSWSISSSQ